MDAITERHKRFVAKDELDSVKEELRRRALKEERIKSHRYMRNARRELQARMKVESLMEMTDFDKMQAQSKKQGGLQKVMQDATSALVMVERARSSMQTSVTKFSAFDDDLELDRNQGAGDIIKFLKEAKRRKDYE